MAGLSPYITNLKLTSFIREHLVAAAMPGQWRFDPSLKTDSDPQTVMLGVVRSRLLANLPKNIPYKLEVTKIDIDFLMLISCHSANCEHVGV